MNEDVTAVATQYLFFKLNESDFAAKAERVKEVVNAIQITKVPRANKAVRGVTNIRGELIPVVDLNIRFDLSETCIKEKTTLVILTLFNGRKQRYLDISMLVDLVDKVEDIRRRDILPPPTFGLSIPEVFVENMIRMNDDYIPVLNIDTILDLGALSKTEEVSG